MTQLNCRAGDLAVSINAYNKANIGLIVRVLQLSSPVEQFGMKGHLPAWEIEVVNASDKLTYLLPDNNQGIATGKIFYAVRGFCPDAYLRPITPPKEASSEVTAKDRPLILEEELCDA